MVSAIKEEASLRASDCIGSFDKPLLGSNNDAMDRLRRDLQIQYAQYLVGTVSLESGTSVEHPLNEKQETKTCSDCRATCLLDQIQLQVVPCQS